MVLLTQWTCDLSQLQMIAKGREAWQAAVHKESDITEGLKNKNTKKDHIPWPTGIHPKFINRVQYMQISQCNTPFFLKKEKLKKHRIISIDGEKEFDKIQHSFTIRKKKTFIKMGTQRTYFNFLKAIYDQPIVNIILNG